MKSKLPRREAAVLVPVFRVPDDGLRMLLVRRGPEGVHGGQIAFPGGMRDVADQTLLDTARREAWEELTISAAEIKILASLPPRKTLTTGVTVFPFLGQILNPGHWSPSEREIAEVFDLPVQYFTKPESHDYGLESFHGWPAPRRVSFYRVGSHRAWGLTYRILQPLVPRLLAGEWPL
jgi:8-oxo-dGTP pyrophosphatase MutT (NUDIX family)